EMTVIPWYTTAGGPLLQGIYNQRLDNGEYNIQASGTYPNALDANGNEIGGNEFRGHIFAKGYQNIGDFSRIGFDINRTSDDTFLRRYSLGDQRVLFSRIYGEMAENRNYLSTQALSMQGLRITDNRKTTPLVLPMIQGYYETRPDDNGIRYHVAGDAQALSRSQGVDQRRLSATVGASLPYITEGGHVFTATLNLRQDMYQTDNNNGVDATTYRTIPQAALEWRYPLMERFGNETMTVEPIVMTVLQPRGSNPWEISNEDSNLLELTDTNIFSINRMPGLDEVDSGPRVAYGARTQYLFGGGTSLDALLGQSFNPSSSTPFPNSTDLKEDFSDFIGRLAFSYAPVTVAYRFALDNKGLALNRNEASLHFAKPWLSVMTSFRSIRNNRYVSDSEEGELHATLPVNENWSVYGSARRNFTIDQFISTGAGIVFKNECFNIGLDTIKIYTRDRDVEPTMQYMLHVAFKNLGEFGGR
ncbi:MAG: LPS-assembly protein LptD, partial [Proteobacteria bacterium]|nr:LPS-assembly protein LptD [Pseudomonadota bacterium]